MIFLFGTRARDALIVIVTFACLRCGVTSAQRVLHRTLRYTVFFVPLIPLRSTYRVECPSCGLETRLSKDQAMHALEWAVRNRGARR
ncbi:zinc-ribbon domain-containing protein [Clavibacter michiganensis]|uniref:zinc-ribbon domain-containing protein n=1 Tax=Clavibacter michiganensis TaxID=28447 RepID=UPI00136623BB|nr:zinc-ribbon domain-containing protein [Clavibacter michiganensis]MDO4028745.1 zinc-ribbon domain-containing protein [Clavibacter michiganensis]MWJ41394.1 zinc-ribbon domain-containing protein [Clavibacter michiganensis subsp. michiganensis]